MSVVSPTPSSSPYSVSYWVSGVLLVLSIGCGTRRGCVGRSGVFSSVGSPFDGPRRGGRTRVLDTARGGRGTGTGRWVRSRTDRVVEGSLVQTWSPWESSDSSRDPEVKTPLPSGPEYPSVTGRPSRGPSSETSLPVPVFSGPGVPSTGDEVGSTGSSRHVSPPPTDLGTPYSGRRGSST